MEKAFRAIGGVIGDDGRPIVDARGAEPGSCSAWREVLGKIDDELNIWARLFRRMFGITPDPLARDLEEPLGADEEIDADADGLGSEDHPEGG